jgi:hypothetical protein
MRPEEKRADAEEREKDHAVAEGGPNAYEQTFQPGVAHRPVRRCLEPFPGEIQRQRDRQQAGRSQR